MANPVLRGGGRYPFWFENITDYYDLSSGNFDPVGDYQASGMTDADESVMWSYVKNGFGVKNATDDSGILKVVTWSDFDAYVKANKDMTAADYVMASITTRTVQLSAGEWCVTPIVKVYEYDETSVSTILTINIGRIL
jgi:hypothetical protein